MRDAALNSFASSGERLSRLEDPARLALLEDCVEEARGGRPCALGVEAAECKASAEYHLFVGGVVMRASISSESVI